MRANNLRSSLAAAVLLISGCAATPGKQASRLYIDDKAITSTIIERHAESTDLNQGHIFVETLYGVVLLTGETNNPLQKLMAQQLAEKVEGVKAVHNQIRTPSEAVQTDIHPPNIDQTGSKVPTGIEL